MTKATQKIMRKFSRDLDKYVGMEMSHCGHEGPAMEAAYAGVELKEWLKGEIEKLAVKAGER